MAAELPSAGAQAPEDLGLITYADLPKLDPGMKYRSQVLYEIPEVDPSVCRKIKQDLGIIEGVFTVDQLHFQTALMDLLQADIQGLYLFLFILRRTGNILFRCQTHNLLKGLHDLVVRLFMRLYDHFPELDAAGSFHHYFISFVQFQTAGRKVIDLSGPAEPHACYCSHKILLKIIAPSC